MSLAVHLLSLDLSFSLATDSYRYSDTGVVGCDGEWGPVADIVSVVGEVAGADVAT